MKLANKILSKLKEIDEGQHFNTKVRNLEGMGSRAIRLTVKEAKKMVENMLNNQHPSPNPKTSADSVLLKESALLMDQTMKRLKEVKDSKK